MLKNIFQYILSHSIFIGFCAVAMAFETVELLHMPFDTTFYYFLFFATVAAYNFHWIVSGIKSYKGLWSYVFHNRKNSFWAFIIGAGLAMYYFVMEGLTLNDIMVPVGLTILYSLPLIHPKIFQLTRKLGFFKTILLAFVWAYATAYLPLHQSFFKYNAISWIMVANRFCFLFVLCIIFDKRDKEVDKAKGVINFATQLSTKSLYNVVMFVFFAWSITNILAYVYGLFNYQAVAMQAVTVITYLVYLMSSKKRGYFFYYFLVDGLMILSAIITGLASN